VPGVGGLEHVQHFWAADLADDDAVGAHAKGVANQLTQRDLASALHVGWTRLEPDNMGGRGGTARRRPRWSEYTPSRGTRGLSCPGQRREEPEVLVKLLNVV
jgi:hypothetical protein